MAGERPRPPESTAAAYSVGGSAWAAGPSRVYARLAERLVDATPVPLTGRLVCDVGAGTGVASQAALAAGARVVATDIAPGMLAVNRSGRPAAVAADATNLPFPDSSFGAVVAAYCYNHLDNPVLGLREARRVTATGAPVLASAYAEHDDHPVKEAAEQALREAGWAAPAFYRDLKRDAVPRLATVERAREATETAGFRSVRVEPVHVPFPDLSVADLVEWRLGMAQTAWFVAALAPEARAAITARVVELLGADVPMLVRSVIHITAIA